MGFGSGNMLPGGNVGTGAGVPPVDPLSFGVYPPDHASPLESSTLASRFITSSNPNRVCLAKFISSPYFLQLRCAVTSAAFPSLRAILVCSNNAVTAISVEGSIPSISAGTPYFSIDFEVIILASRDAPEYLLVPLLLLIMLAYSASMLSVSSSDTLRSSAYCITRSNTALAPSSVLALAIPPPAIA